MFRSPSKDPAPANPEPKASGAPTPQQPPEPRPEPAAAAPQPQSQAPAQQPRRESTASVLGADLLIKGGIEGRGEIQLQGRAWGDVKVERLVVGDAAELEGSVDAVVVEIRGRVAGSITARQVRLLPTARVEGDITYEQLAIEMGAQFEGKVIRNKAPAQQAAVAAPQAKERSNGGAPAAQQRGPSPAPAAASTLEPANAPAAGAPAADKTAATDKASA